MVGIRSRTPHGSIGQLPGNEDTALAADLHAIKALIKACYGLAIALREWQRLGRLQLGLAIVAHHRLSFNVLHW